MKATLTIYRYSDNVPRETLIEGENSAQCLATAAEYVRLEAADVKFATCTVHGFDTFIWIGNRDEAGNWS